MRASSHKKFHKYGFIGAACAVLVLIFAFIVSFMFKGHMRDIYEYVDKKDCTSALSELRDIESSYGMIVSIISILPSDSIRQSYQKTRQLKRECEEIVSLKDDRSLHDKFYGIIKNLRLIYEEILDLKYPEDYDGVSLPEVDKDIEFANTARIKLFANAGVQFLSEFGNKLLVQVTGENPSPYFCMDLYYIQNNSFIEKEIQEGMSTFKLHLKEYLSVLNVLCVQEILEKYNPDNSYASIFNIQYGHVPVIAHNFIKYAIAASVGEKERERANSLLVDFLSMHQSFCSMLKEKPGIERISLGAGSSEKVRVGKDGDWLPHIQSQLLNLYVGCSNAMLNRARTAYSNKKYKDAKKILDHINTDQSNGYIVDQINKYQVLVDIAIAKSERAASLSPIRGERYSGIGPAKVILINGTNSTLTLAMTGTETVKQKIPPCIECKSSEDRCNAQDNIARFALKPGDYQVLVKASSSGRTVKPFVGVYELKEGFLYSQCFIIKSTIRK
ncbi:hypothetical protein [Pleionea sediminis]|uniref:hypothetical protein n=1 Tax=Pleionea sediminis TaxID=2569479 RepID=UPI0011869FAF|nr:hypothetical protein [Pleionea sediminis]